MASSDPKQGGDLFDMAKDGTSIPGDAGKQNLIPSVPRPDQIATDSETGAITEAGAADNATDIPRVRSHVKCRPSPVYGKVPAVAQSFDIRVSLSSKQPFANFCNRFSCSTSFKMLVWHVRSSVQ